MRQINVHVAGGGDDGDGGGDGGSGGSGEGGGSRRCSSFISAFRSNFLFVTVNN